MFKRITPYLFLMVVLSLFSPMKLSIILDFHKNNRHNLQKIDGLFFLSNYKTKELSMKYEELPLKNTINDEMIVNICLGTPKQCFNVLVDSGSFYLWVSDKYSSGTPDSQMKFDSLASSTFVNLKKEYSLLYGTGSAKGIICSETISIGKNTTLNNLQFVLVYEEEGHTQLDGILGLGYYYDDFEPNALKFSLIDRLYSEKLVKRKLFTQKYTDDKKGVMMIGDLPEEITNDFTNYGFCSAVKNTKRGLNPRWECMLKATFYGYQNENLNGNLEKINAPALFDTGTNLILIPYLFLKNLLSSYFKDFAAKGECRLVGSEDGFFSITCSSFSNVLSLPPFNFIFDDWILRLNPIEMFYRYPDNSIRFVMVSSLSMNMWIMGEPLLKKYHMVFDKENNQIGFYGKEDKFKSDIPFPTQIDTLTIVIIVISVIFLIAMIVLLVMWYFKNKRTQIQYYDPNKYFIQSK